MKNSNFETRSYESHKSHFKAYSSGGLQADLAHAWLNKGTVDAWRHQRIYHTVDPLIQIKPESSWLTVGDGRYGLDAQYLLGKKCIVTASDISELLLKEAFDQGLVTSFSAENAEALTFNDEEFDFVLCKDAFHHFPRPIKALYEMLRVAKRGVVLIEPSDHKLHGGLLDWAQTMAKRVYNHVFAGKKLSCSTDYEESGNYVYRLSKREMEKVALGLNYPLIAFMGINDYFHIGMINESLVDRGTHFRRAKMFIAAMDILSRLRLRDYRLISVIFLKGEESEENISILRNSGYEVKQLTRNPYISS